MGSHHCLRKTSALVQAQQCPLWFIQHAQAPCFAWTTCIAAALGMTSEHSLPVYLCAITFSPTSQTSSVSCFSPYQQHARRSYLCHNLLKGVLNTTCHRTGDYSPCLPSSIHRPVVPFHRCGVVPCVPSEGETGAWRGHLQQPGLWHNHPAGAVCLGTIARIPAPLEKCEALRTGSCIYASASPPSRLPCAH